MGRIREEAQHAINNRSPVGLEKYLGLYIELLNHTVQLNQETGADNDRTPAPISRLIDQIYREFYHILDGIAQTGNSDLINTARGEIYRLAATHHRQHEPYLFSKSIALYDLYYWVLADNSRVGDTLIHGLLSSLDNLRTRLVGSMKRARSVEEVEQARTDVGAFYETLERILQGAIEKEDAQTFNNVWNLGDDDFVLIRPETEIHQFHWKLDEAEDKAEQARLEQELAVKQQQQDAVEQFQTQFAERQFIAAAWAYREVREDNLGAPVFQEMCEESISTYQFSTLAELYFRLCTDVDLNLLRWESEDGDVFKGIQASQPASRSWLQEFFCSMGLLFLDTEECDTDDLSEATNPLARTDIERANYPDLSDTIEAVSIDDLAATGIPASTLDDLEDRKAVFLELHRHMEKFLERRETERVIDADLDPDKVSEFKTKYVSTFRDKFVLRTVFDDIGWLETQLYEEQEDVNPTGYNLRYPKQGFVPNPPTHFIHSIDRRVQSHINGLTRTWLEGNQKYLEDHRIPAYDAVPDGIRQTFQDLEDQGQEAKALLIGSHRVLDILADNGILDRRVRSSELLAGEFDYANRSVPVYNLSSTEFDAIVLAGTDQSATLTEYHRDESPVFVDIKKITRQQLEEQAAENEEELSEDELREQLQRVQLKALYYAEFNATEYFGTKITITEPR